MIRVGYNRTFKINYISSYILVVSKKDTVYSRLFTRGANFRFFREAKQSREN